MIFPPKPARPDLAGGNGRFRYLCPGIGMTVSLPFPALEFWKESFGLKLSSKMIAASKDTPFLPLKPLISRVEPEEKSCSRCWSVSSLFEKWRNTNSPHRFTVAFRDFGLHHHVAGLALGARRRMMTAPEI